MKRRFTILTAAFALLAILAIPMGMKGQTKITDYNNIVSGTSYYIGATTSGTDYYLSVDGSSLAASIAGTAVTAQSSATPFIFQGSGNNWTIQFDDETGYYLSLKNSKDNGKVQVVESAATFIASNQSSKIRLQISGASFSIQKNNSGTQFGSYGNTQTDIWLMEVPAVGPVTYTVTFDANDGTFIGSTDLPTTNNTVEAGTYTLPTATKDGYSFDGWTITGDQTLYTGSYNVSGNVDFTAQYTEETPVSGYVIDFESSVNSYTDWTFNNIPTQQTNAITAHGGTYYGTTDGKATASITTSSIVANPGALTCYVSKTTNNTTTSTWAIEVSDDGNNWVEVENRSATDMSKGEWKEFTADLSSYSNVYVRVYYSGSTAVRAIDDLSLTTITPSPAVATTTTISVPTDFNNDLHNGTNAGTLSATVTAEGSPISGATVTWSSSNTGVATIDANGAVTLVAVGTTTITANYAGVEDEYRPSTGTYELTVTDSNAPGTENNPYTVAQAITATPSNGNVYIQGIVSSFYNTSIVGDGNNFRYYISDDGTTTTQLLVYKGKGLNEATFTNADDLLVGDEVVICGTLITYQNAPEVASGNYLYSWNRPSTPSQEYTLTVTASENVEIFTFVGESTDPGVEGSTTLQVYNGTEVGLSVSVTEGYVLTLMVDGTDVTSQLDESGYYTFNMPNHDVTVTATAVEFVPSTSDEYTLYTGELIEGDYLIVYDGGAMNTTVENDRLQFETVAITNDVIVTDNAEIVWHIAPSGEYWTIYNADAEAYAASTGAKNKAQMLADGTDDKALWTVSGTETYDFVNKNNAANSVNANLRKNGTYGFACYSTSTGGALSLYKKVETLPANSIVIEGYGESEGGYYLIASPFTVSPEDVQGMTEGEYDLYSFDEAEENEWRNYKAGAFTNLEPGKGYLYAHSTTVTLTFDGEAYNDEPIVLKKTDGGDFPGWNLVGNPYTETAYIDRDFYVMNPETGGEIITGEGNEIAPMQGFFVIADQDGEELEISTTAPNTTGEKVIMNVTSNRGNVIDRAIVRFGEGRQLPKFQLRDNSTKISIAKDNSEYAVVRSEAEGEMPVSFKAENNGTYTFSVNTENVEMEYLHLIDNMTGADIDLIANPSYSFEAKVTDYASRFRLVFSANSSVNEQNANNFAFFNGNDWTINNEGEATLQVVDMTGRVLSTETINGNATTKVNAATGVYMLRLINGNNIKTQKVVVK